METTGSNCTVWERFLEQYKPSEDLVKPSEHVVAVCRHVGVTDEIVDFMEKFGFGNYGSGILKLIDPEDYFQSLFTWLGKEDYTKIPFMMTAFGDLFYYRILGDGEYDISLLNIHYRRIDVPAWTVSEFVQYLVDPSVQESVLRKELFEKAVSKCGSLGADDIFFFAPALVIGGAEDVEYISKGNAKVHHQVLFQLGQ